MTLEALLIILVIGAVAGWRASGVREHPIDLRVLIRRMRMRAPQRQFLTFDCGRVNRFAAPIGRGGERFHYAVDAIAILARAL